MKHFNLKRLFEWTRNQKLLYYIFIVALVVPNIVLVFTEETSFFGRVCNIVFPVAMFWFLMSLARKPGKALWLMFWFVFLDAFQLVLLYLFGNSIIAVDMFLNLLTTNSGEAGELLAGIIVGVVIVVVFYLIILSLAIISLFNKERLSRDFLRHQRKLSGNALMYSTILCVCVLLFSSRFRIEEDVYPLNVCYNALLAIDRADKTADYYETSNGFKYNASSTRDANEPEVYVFVVGETARAMDFGIYGYKRNTTPELAKCGDNLLVYKDALSQSNTTHKSVPMLLSSASAENYDAVYTHKGIITAFNEAGYRTAFLSNQRHNNSFIDFYGGEATTSIFIKDLYPEGANVMDAELLKHLKRELRNDHRKKFIVLHSYGSHYDYYSRYGREFAEFTPDSVKELSRKNRELLVNSYDNSIRYTDAFVKSVIDAVDALGVSSAVIYTSDHGEDIFDDSRNMFLHASPLPSYYQIHVPYLVWVSDTFKSQHEAEYNMLKANVNEPISTSLVTFHTLLSMAGIRTFVFDGSCALSDHDFKARDRYYLSDHNKPKLLNECGLKECDFEKFREFGLREY